MSQLLALPNLRAGVDDHGWTGPASGPAGKRTFGRQLTAQSLVAASRTVPRGKPPTSVHLQFLRGGDAGDEVDYTVTATLAQEGLIAER
jgi:acyl-CoA thioesterase